MIEVACLRLKLEGFKWQCDDEALVVGLMRPCGGWRSRLAKGLAGLRMKTGLRDILGAAIRTYICWGQRP